MFTSIFKWHDKNGTKLLSAAKCRRISLGEGQRQRALSRSVPLSHSSHCAVPLKLLSVSVRRLPWLCFLEFFLLSKPGHALDGLWGLCSSTVVICTSTPCASELRTKKAATPTACFQGLCISNATR